LVIAAAKKENEPSAVASAPSSSAASAPRASASDLQPRLQAQKELPKTLNAAGEDGSDADTGADVSHAAALETGKGKNRVQDAGQGICHLRAVQARLFPFKMFPVCAVVASASFLCARFPLPGVRVLIVQAFPHTALACFFILFLRRRANRDQRRQARARTAQKEARARTAQKSEGACGQEHR